MLMPNCLRSERCTSATVTLSITCSSPSTVSRLMTSLVSLPQAAAWSGLGSTWALRGSVSAVRPARLVLAELTTSCWRCWLAGDELAGDVAGALGIDRRAHRCRSARRRCPPSPTWMLEPGTKRLQEIVERAQIGADRDLQQSGSAGPCVSKKKALVWPDLLGDQEHAVGRLHDGIDLLRVGDEHVLELEGKLHQHRLALTERDPLGDAGSCRVAGNAAAPIAATDHRCHALAVAAPATAAQRPSADDRQQQRRPSPSEIIRMVANLFAGPD